MIRERQLFINILTSTGQVVVTGASFLVLYRFVKDAVGIDYFGVWALVLATTSVSSLANLGMATSMVKFVSMYLARERTDRVIQIVQTAALSLAIFLAVALAILYPLAVRLLPVVLTPELLPAALAILPYAFLSFWLTSIAGVLHGSIDGYQRLDLRNLLLMAVALMYLGATFLLVPSRGLTGLAQAQLFQAILLLISSWIILRRLLPALPILPHQWQRSAFTEILGYSLQFQLISICKLLFEPLTKFLVTIFGGAAATGFFEFAYRMVFQLRALIVTAHQSIVPAIADLQERHTARIHDIYKTSLQLVLYLVLGSLPFLIALTPLVSQLWLGSHEPLFITFAVLLLVGWFVNMLSNPAYFGFLGIGLLRWNVTGHLIIGLLNGGLGWLCGWFYGVTGVVAGFVTALVAGSVTIALAYQRTYAIRFSEVVQKESVWLGIASLAGMALALWTYDSERLMWSLWAVPGSFALIVILPLWRHPARRQVQSWVNKRALQHSSDIKE